MISAREDVDRTVCFRRLICKSARAVADNIAPFDVSRASIDISGRATSTVAYALYFDQLMAKMREIKNKDPQTTKNVIFIRRITDIYSSGFIADIL